MMTIIASSHSHMLFLDLQPFAPQTKLVQGKPLVFDLVRKKWLVHTPEEWIRQQLLQYLIAAQHYPLAKMAVERMIQVHGRKKRFDVVVYNASLKPWMVVECKAPHVPIDEAAFHQLLQYQNVLQASYLLLTNGLQSYCADVSKLPALHWLDTLPAYQR